jgi:hypothetical protein
MESSKLINELFNRYVLKLALELFLRMGITGFLTTGICNVVQDLHVFYFGSLVYYFAQDQDHA